MKPEVLNVIYIIIGWFILIGSLLMGVYKIYTKNVVIGLLFFLVIFIMLFGRKTLEKAKDNIDKLKLSRK